MVGRGGGDRTICGVEDAQVIDSWKRQKDEKRQKRRTEVHARSTQIEPAFLDERPSDGTI